jgi:hypothetical protein
VPLLGLPPAFLARFAAVAALRLRRLDCRRGTQLPLRRRDALLLLRCTFLHFLLLPAAR